MKLYMTEMSGNSFKIRVLASMLGVDYENIRIETMLTAQATGEYEMMQNLVEEYMAEYDISGWTVPDMVQPWDVNRLKGGFN